MYLNCILKEYYRSMFIIRLNVLNIINTKLQSPILHIYFFKLFSKAITSIKGIFLRDIINEFTNLKLLVNSS